MGAGPTLRVIGALSARIGASAMRCILESAAIIGAGCGALGAAIVGGGGGALGATAFGALRSAVCTGTRP
ncbi:MAG: hypothetical protein EWM45_00460 [Rhodopseudomonas palustris]|nr:MAG: hypothetical protein EWM45_00460 [Rhodopseudomonas palustris]